MLWLADLTPVKWNSYTQSPYIETNTHKYFLILALKQIH